MDENESIVWYRREAEESAYARRKSHRAGSGGMVKAGDVITSIRTIGGEWVETSSVAAKVIGGMVRVNGYWYSVRDVKVQRAEGVLFHV